MRLPHLTERSPFLALSQPIRLALLFYLIAYRIVFPLIHILLADGSKDLLALRVLAELLYTLLLAYPFIFYRREYGWLHPLVLPTIYLIGKSVVKSPLSLVLPWQMPFETFEVETGSSAEVLSLNDIDLAWMRLRYTLILCLAQATYLGFFLFGPTFRVPKLRFYEPRNIAGSATIFLGMLVVLALAFVVAKGGVTEVLVGMRGGRRVLIEDSGHLVFAGMVAPMIALVWFGYARNAWSNPGFLIALVASLLISIIVSGSRSSVILPALAILLLWWLRRGRVLLLPTMLAGVFGLLVIGTFGAIRQDFRSTHVDYSVLNPANVGRNLENAFAEIGRRRNEESALAVVAGAQQHGLLWGRTYANATLFWIPRAIWSGKPRAADTYNMWMNFNGNRSSDNIPSYGVWGIPVTAETEAFWNLGYVGVILIFALLGCFHATLARAAHVFREVPFFWVAYIYILLNFDGTSKTMVDLLRYVGVLVVFAIVAGIIRLQRAPAERASVARA